MKTRANIQTAVTMTMLLVRAPPAPMSSATVVVAVSPLEDSVLVALTVRAKPASLLAGGVMLREDKVQPETSTAVLPA